MGTVRDPAPVTGFAANFSPIPRIAPPPFGRLKEGSGAAFADNSGELARSFDESVFGHTTYAPLRQFYFGSGKIHIFP
jgi:hypothetical protein